ncbi:MAG TPA: DUF1566 domain-containing protein [Phycisphaerae bacterium]|nr:DUF1566 domain-containing protein [Phycisphaerae bacterium]HUU82375.1 DUF1566 domain-containing protein [Phycisphaerae bacterium]
MSWIKELLTHELPPTGQTTSYADYDDGYYETGWPGATRFRDNGDGTIQDFATGLIWVKQPELIIPNPGWQVHPTNQIQVAEGDWIADHEYLNADLVKYVANGKFYVCIAGHGSVLGLNDPITAEGVCWIETVWTASAADLTTPATMAWAAALVNCHALDYAGNTDWRLPNILELASIINHAYTGAKYHYNAYFPNGKVDFPYWTGTTYEKNTIWAMYTAFGTATSTPHDKVNTDHVRPVRGGFING